MNRFIELILIFLFGTLSNVAYTLGMIIAVKCFKGKVLKLTIGSGSKLFHYKKLQINTAFFMEAGINYKYIKYSNNKAVICICLFGSLINIIIGIILGILVILNVLEKTYIVEFLAIYNFYYGIINLVPMTWHSGKNTSGKVILQIIKHGCYSYTGEYNNSLLEYSISMRAHDLINDDKYIDALNLLDELHESKKNFPLALLYRGDAYYLLKRYNEAIEEFHNYIKLKPNQVVGYSYLSSCYFLLNDLDNYFKYNYEAYKLDKENPLFLNNLADYYNTLGNYNEAINHAKTGIKLNPNYNLLYCTLSESYLLLNDMDNFYKYIEIAFKKGYTFEQLCTSEFLKDVINDVKMQNIINRYSTQNA